MLDKEPSYHLWGREILKKSGKKEHQKSVPDELFFLGQARKYAGLASKALKRGDGTAALAHTVHSSYHLGMLNALIREGRVRKPNWFRVHVKKMLIELSVLVDAVPDEEA